MFVKNLLGFIDKLWGRRHFESLQSSLTQSRESINIECGASIFWVRCVWLLSVNGWSLPDLYISQRLLDKGKIGVIKGTFPDTSKF